MCYIILMNKIFWVIVFAILVVILGIVYGTLGILKNLRISAPIIVPEKITIELSGTPEIRIPQIEGSLSLKIPTKFDVSIDAKIPSDLSIRGSLDIKLPEDFTIDIKGLDKMFLTCPHCEGGTMVPTVIKLSPIGKTSIVWQCTKCHKKLQP